MPVQGLRTQGPKTPHSQQQLTLSLSLKRPVRRVPSPLRVLLGLRFQSRPCLNACADTRTLGAWCRKQQAFSESIAQQVKTYFSGLAKGRHRPARIYHAHDDDHLSTRVAPSDKDKRQNAA